MGNFSDQAYGFLDSINPFSKPKVDTSQSDADIERTRQLADAYANERHAFQDRTDGMAPQQQGAINQLGDAAAGRTKSAAELQLQQQGATDAARQFAMASAMRGHSPGSALRAATEGATATTAATNANAAILRAQEQANARSQYAQAIQGARGQNLTQQQNDDAWRKALLDANLTASGQAVTGSTGQLAAQTAAMQAQQQQKGAIFNAAGSLFGISDEEAKTHVRTKKLADALADEVRGVTFEYRPEHEAEGGPGKHYGILAQALERVVPGVVSKGKDGLRRVAVDHLSMANTGLISELANRIRDLEGRKAA